MRSKQVAVYSPEPFKYHLRVRWARAPLYSGERSSVRIRNKLACLAYLHSK